jgi:hypothetical protein
MATFLPKAQNQFPKPFLIEIRNFLLKKNSIILKNINLKSIPRTKGMLKLPNPIKAKPLSKTDNQNRINQS